MTAVGVHRRRVDAAVLVGPSVVEVAGPLEVRAIGRGDVPLLDLARVWLEAHGPASLYLTTWSNSGAALGEAIVPWLEAHRAELREVRVAVRASLARLVPGACADLQALHPGALVEAESHAEVLVLIGDGWSRVALSTEGVFAFGLLMTLCTTADPAVAAALVGWFRSRPPIRPVARPPEQRALSLGELVEGLSHA